MSDNMLTARAAAVVVPIYSRWFVEDILFFPMLTYLTSRLCLLCPYDHQNTGLLDCANPVTYSTTRRRSVSISLGDGLCL